MQALAERVPRLRVELGSVGEDQVLQAGNSRPGELLVVLLDAPLQLGKEVVQKERRDDCKILKREIMTIFAEYSMERRYKTWSIFAL